MNAFMLTAPIKNSDTDTAGKKHVESVVTTITPGSFITEFGSKGSTTPGSMVTDIGSNESTAKSGGDADFMSFFNQISTKKHTTSGKSAVIVNVSNIFPVGAKFKALILVNIVDEKGMVYWCYKANLMGSIYAAAAHVLKLDTTVFDNFKICFKRAAESAKEIEMWSADKNRMKTLKPEIHGNKVLAVPVEGTSEVNLSEKIKATCDAINRINNHDMMPKWMQAALASDKMNFNVKFQNSTMNDNTYWKILKTSAIIEENVPLDSTLTYEATAEIVQEFFMDGERLNPKHWDNALKAVAFAGGVVPTEI